MNILLKVIFTFCALTALSLNSFAQDEETAAEAGSALESPAQQAPQTAPAADKSTAKRKKIKRNKPAGESEYKFKSPEQTPAYKFDKKANPIIKPAKKKKKAKASAGGAGAAIPKLKKVKSIGEEDSADPAAALGLPPGTKIPGAEGK